MKYKKVINEYVEFYTKNSISPVRQNIEDFSLHVQRRSNLYRQLGLLSDSFKDKKVLEVGPGGGYNALVNYSFQPSKYVLIEPNKTGFNELKENFRKHGFEKNLSFQNCFLEDFESDERFDIVWCEGLIQGLPNREEFLKKLSFFVKDGGVLAITVADEISMFFEVLRRYLANELIKNEENFDKQITILMEAFSSHLDTLKGMTRRYDDWCADLICDAIYNHTFSVVDALEMFKDSYFFYGASPNVFQDFRWYKTLPYVCKEYNKYYLNQFDTQRHNFINCAEVYGPRHVEKNRELSSTCKEFIQIVKSLEKKDSIYTKVDLKKTLEKIEHNFSDIDIELEKAVREVIELCQEDEICSKKVANLKYVKPLFGRGQVFVSFQKIG